MCISDTALHQRDEGDAMKLAIMQPYLFPYIGYFQLIKAVDTFVIYDDVNYIKGGWINRNYILSQGGRQRITLEVLEASPNRLINQVLVGGNVKKIARTIQQSYAKAPYFREVYPIVEGILMQDSDNLSRFLTNGLQELCVYLGIKPDWFISSDLKKDNCLRGQDKVLAICEELGAKQYINAPGGKELYAPEDFAERGINLSFIQPHTIAYHQFDNEFTPNLSIIDVMMFNDQESCNKLLEEYELV